jgi:hypothetical protein
MLACGNQKTAMHQCGGECQFFVGAMFFVWYVC